MAQGTDEDGRGAAPSPEELRGEMKRTRRILSRKLSILKQRMLWASNSSTESERIDMPANTTKSKRSKRSTTRKKSAKGTSSVVTEKVKKVIGTVLTAAAAGAVKGAVKEVIPPVEKAAGITEERMEEQERRKRTNRQK